MTELPPEAAALIEQARLAHGPKQGDRDRVLIGLHASLGIGAVTALAAASATASAAESAALTNAAGAGNAAAFGWKSALLTWKAGKVVLATMALGGAIGVGAVSRGPHGANDSARRTNTPVMSAPVRPAKLAHQPIVDAQQATAPAVLEPVKPAQVVEAPAAVPSDPVPPARLEPATSPRSTLDGVDAVAEPSTKRTSRATRRHAAEVRSGERRGVTKALVATPVSTAAVAAVSAAVTAEAPAQANAEPDEAVPAAVAAKAEGELALVRRALTSLRDHDAETALALLADHAARYPSGAFATERRGLRVVALCAAGLIDQGQREQAAFLRDASSSPIAERVRRACSGDGQ